MLARLGWAKLLKRVFEIDREHRPKCGSQLKMIAAILEPPVLEKKAFQPSPNEGCGGIFDQLGDDLLRA